jgi:hypothetical protein
MNKLIVLPMLMFWALAHAQTGYCPLSGCTLTGPVASPSINNVQYADQYPGSDIGAQINAAVRACVAATTVCNINVAKGGTISTPPELPAGFSLTFNPTAQYTLATNWVMDHRGTTYNFNGAHFYFTLRNNSSAFYVGKNDASVVNASGNTVTWVSGSKFSNIDIGDQLAIDTGSFGPAGANVAAVNAGGTQITLTASLPTPYTNARMAVYMQASDALGGYPGRSVVIKDLNIDNANSAANTALTVELADGVAVYDLTASLFSRGTCLALKGAITGNFYSTRCNSGGFGIDLDQNTIGGFMVSTSNANRFFGIDLTGSPAPTGVAILFNGAADNDLYATHAEGEQNHTVVLFQAIRATGYPRTLNSGGNLLQISDFERNGDNTKNATDIAVNDGSASNTVEGGTFTSIYTGSGSGLGTQIGIAVASTATSTAILNTGFADNYAVSYRFQSGATGLVFNVATVGEAVNPANVWNLKTGIAVPAVNSPSYSVSGRTGFTGTKTAGKCVLTIASGIITGVSGC